MGTNEDEPSPRGLEMELEGARAVDAAVGGDPVQVRGLGLLELQGLGVVGGEPGPVRAEKQIEQGQVAREVEAGSVVEPWLVTPVLISSTSISLSL